jgi:HEAT repeat protein/ATP/ADP translocase
MTRLLRLLNLRRNEVPRICLAAALFFLVAVDDGIVKSVSSGVFNIRVGPDRLPEMYGWIAVLFSLTMVGLSWLTTKITRQRLVFGLFTALAVFLAFNTAALFWARDLGEAAGGAAAATPFPGFYAFLFVSSELIRNIAGFQVWIVAGGICYSSRAKVLFPLLAASTTLGDISGGFLVRVLGDLLDSWQVYGLAALNTVVAIALLRPLMRRYFVASDAGDDEGGGATLAENLRYFAGSSYLRLLFVLSLVLFALYTTIHYGFNVVARTYYPEEGEITAFFGLFFGLAGLATLLTTTLLLRHLLRWLGVGNIYLWVCVSHVGIAAMLALVFGDVLSLPPVWLILGLNLLNYVLLDSVIAPTYQVLMKVVPDRHSDGTRMIMEGGFMLVGGLLGAGITLLHARDALTLWELFGVLFLIAGAMVVVGWRLRQRYREVLVEAVREQDVDVEDDAAMRELLSASSEIPRGLLLHSSDGVRDLGIDILRRDPAVAAGVCLPLVAHENPRIRAAAFDALTGSGDGSVIRAALVALDDEDGQVRLRAARAIARTVERAAARMSPELRQEVVDAIAPRLQGGGAAVPAEQAEFLFLLETLEHDASGERRADLLHSLLDSTAVESICAGVDVVRRLEQVSRNPRVQEHLAHPHPAVREAAVRAVARLDTQEACVALVEALADPDPDVVEVAVDALEEAAPQHGTFLVEGLARTATKQWEGLVRSLARTDDEQVAAALMADGRERLLEANRNLVIVEGLRSAPTDAAGLLRDQLEMEAQTVRDAAIGLLGRLGDVDVVAGLVQRMNDDEPGARDKAIELLENIGNRALMEPLLPLLTDDDEERLTTASRLSGWSLHHIDWDRALAAVLQSPDPWTQLAAAWAAQRMERRGPLSGLRDDAPDFVKEIVHMDATADRDDSQPLTNMEKITFLKESPFFAALPLEELYHIALSVQEESVHEGATVIEQGTLGDKMYICVEGRLEVRRFAGEGDREGMRVAELGDKQVFGDMALLDDEPRSASVIALSECRLLSLQRADLSRILRRYSSIAFSMMRILSRRLRSSMAA